MDVNIKQVSRIEYTGPYTIINTANLGINLSAIVPTNDLQVFISDNERKSDINEDTSSISIVEYKVKT